MATKRVIVTIRLGVDGVAAIDRIATAEDRSRSEMVRVLLKEAMDARLRKTR